MKLVDFKKFGAHLETHSDGYSIHLASGRILGVLPKSPDPASLEIESHHRAPMPAWATQHALNAELKYDYESLQLKRDADLSEAGRLKRMAPIVDAAVKSMSAVLTEFGKHTGDILNREIQRYAVPAFDRSDLVGFWRDREIRDAIRGMDATALKQIAGNSEFMLAVMRSPVPLQEHLKEFASTSWRDMIDVRDPVGRATLNQEKAAVDWAERVLGLVRGTLLPELQLSPHELLEKTSALGAAAHWGFGTAEITHADRQREYRATA